MGLGGCTAQHLKPGMSRFISKEAVSSCRLLEFADVELQKQVAYTPPGVRKSASSKSLVTF